MTIELEHINERTKKNGKKEYSAKISGTGVNGVEITLTLKSPERDDIENMVSLNQSLSYNMELTAV